MSTDFVIVAEKRDAIGKGASRRLRRNNKIPAILYGDHGNPEPLVIDHDKIKQALDNEAFYSHILTVKIENEECKVVLKDIQRHAYKPKILHLDLQRVNENADINMSVPLHFLGDDIAPGVKGGGLLSHHIAEIEIKCKPRDLPAYIEVDVSQLETGDSIHLSDIQLPEGVVSVDLAHSHDLPVASIQKIRGSIADEAATDSEPSSE